MNGTIRALSVCMFVLLGLFLVVGNVAAQAYKIGPEDVLEIKFWQDKELNSTARVGKDGKISLDIVGQIDAAGKTIEELENLIIRQMTRLNRNISQVVVRVTAYNYLAVFVTGQVRTPGKYTFEEIPDLWTIINEAGGAAETGDLTRVTIIRGGEEAGQVEVVNVARSISEGNQNKLPRIRRLDTIEIPSTPGGLPSVKLGQQFERKNIMYAIGAVNDPGEISYEENVDILEAIAKAGGPTNNADLRRVKVITKDGSYAQSFEVNLEKYASAGLPARYILRKEDSFIIPEKRGGFLGTGLGTAGSIITLVTSTLVVFTTINQLGGNNNNN